MSRRTVQTLVLECVDYASCVSIPNHYGKELQVHVKMGMLLGVNPTQIKKWILGVADPTEDNIDKLTEFLESQKWKRS